MRLELGIRLWCVSLGGRLGSILDGMCEHNFEGNGSFFSFK